MTETRWSIDRSPWADLGDTGRLIAIPLPKLCKLKNEKSAVELEGHKSSAVAYYKQGEDLSSGITTPNTSEGVPGEPEVISTLSGLQSYCEKYPCLLEDIKELEVNVYLGDSALAVESLRKMPNLHRLTFSLSDPTSHEKFREEGDIQVTVCALVKATTREIRSLETLNINYDSVLWSFRFSLKKIESPLNGIEYEVVVHLGASKRDHPHAAHGSSSWKTVMRNLDITPLVYHSDTLGNSILFGALAGRLYEAEELKPVDIGIMQDA
ncbi:hypothetical protein PVAG01_04284 [Phlyctema vagabunda]|uniref:Uncharacterized protein n=1 Tax=Phlyctema vagabunda TaxID=108571 RepID=A0ABR4PP70_9HELO